MLRQLARGYSVSHETINNTFTYSLEDEIILILAYYDNELGEWVELSDITIDPVTNTIKCTGKPHFTIFRG